MVHMHVTFGAYRSCAFLGYGFADVAQGRRRVVSQLVGICFCRTPGACFRVSIYSASVSRLTGTCICRNPGASFRVCVYQAPVSQLVSMCIWRTPGACFGVCTDMNPASRSAFVYNTPRYAAVVGLSIGLRAGADFGCSRVVQAVDVAQKELRQAGTAGCLTVLGDR